MIRLDIRLRWIYDRFSSEREKRKKEKKKWVVKPERNNSKLGDNKALGKDDKWRTKERNEIMGGKYDNSEYEISWNKTE